MSCRRPALPFQESLAVITVTYNSANVLESFLSHIGAQRASIVVVDNASADRSRNLAREGGAKLVGLERNYGFATACNAGAAAVDEPVDWYAFVNPDVKITIEELELMVNDAPSSVVAVAPLLLDGAGRPQRDLARREPTLTSTVIRYLGSSRLDRRNLRSYRALRDGEGRFHPVEVTSGACIAVRSGIYRQVGGFPTAYFLSVEDVELCCRLRRHGDVVVDRSIVAAHDKGMSSAGVDREAWILESSRSVVQFFERCRPGWQVGPVGAAVVLGCLGRGMVTRLRRRAGWRSFFQRYWKFAWEVAGTVKRAAFGGDTPAPRPVFIGESE